LTPSTRRPATIAGSWHLKSRRYKIAEFYSNRLSGFQKPIIVEGNMARPLWQLLMDSQNLLKGKGITCEECFMVLEYYADQLAAGVDPESLHQPVLRHLSRCPDCRSKFAAWLRQLENAAK
jgi:hypothetical protein